MRLIVGTLIVFACVFGSYAAMGGHLLVLWQPFEFVIILGAAIGAFVIGVLSDGLVMMGVSAFWQTVIKGLVIIAAVVVDQAQQRLQARVALQAQGALGK